MSSEEGEVPRKSTMTKVAELNDRIESFRSKLDEVKKKKNTMYDERYSYRTRFKNEQNELEKANVTIETLKADNSGLRDENSRL